jgi:outer membrane protein
MRILMLLFLPLASNAGSLSISFNDLPRLVNERNEHSKGAKSIADSAKVRTGHLFRSYMPSIALKAGQEQFSTGNRPDRSEPYGGVEARINVFNSGKDRLENMIRNEEFVSADAVATATVRDELAKARKIYWQLISQKEIITLFENAAAANDKYLGAANKRIKAGIATEVDRIEFEMAKVEIEQDLARARLQKQNLDRDLRALLALPDTIVIETVAVVDHQHEDQILRAVFDAQADPSLQTEKAESELADLQFRKARLEWLPSIDVIGSRSLHTFREREFEKQDDRWESVVGVQLSMQLVDGWNSQNESAAQKMRAEGLRKQHRQSANEFKSAFDGAKASLELNHQLIHNSEQIIEKGRRYMSRTLDEYRRGAKNSIDVLNASQRVFDLQRRYADLKKDYQLARTDLLKMLGQ